MKKALYFIVGLITGVILLFKGFKKFVNDDIDILIAVKELLIIKITMLLFGPNKRIYFDGKVHYTTRPVCYKQYCSKKSDEMEDDGK